MILMACNNKHQKNRVSVLLLLSIMIPQVVDYHLFDRLLYSSFSPEVNKKISIIRYVGTSNDLISQLINVQLFIEHYKMDCQSAASFTPLCQCGVTLHSPDPAASLVPFPPVVSAYEQRMHNFF